MGTNKSMTYNNLGINKATVKILDQLPNVSSGRRSLNLNVNAKQKELLKNTSLFPAIFTHVIIDESTNFAAWHPSKRIKEVDNVIAGWGVPGEVEWYIGTGAEINSAAGSSAKVRELIENKRDVNEGGEEPGENDIPDAFDVAYDTNLSQAPYFRAAPFSKKTESSNDTVIIMNWASYLIDEGIITQASGATNTIQGNKNKVFWITQEKTRDRLFWGARSSSFLTQNKPFWVSFSMSKEPPASQKHDTYFIISLGTPGDGNVIELVVTRGKNMILLDQAFVPVRTSLTGGTVFESAGDPIISEIEGTKDVIDDTEKIVRIGFLTIAERLVITLDKSDFVYTRPINTYGSAELVPLAIPAGSVRIYGSNSQCKFNVSPMIFSPLAIVPLAIPDGTDGKKYRGYNRNARQRGTVAELPEENGGTLFGVDCRVFYDKQSSGGTSSSTPDGTGFQNNGWIYFAKLGSTSDNLTGGLTEISGPTQDTSWRFDAKSLYFLIFITESSGSPAILNKCPFFFQIRGFADESVSGGSDSGTDVSNYVLSASVEGSAPDYFHVTQNATVTLYNENGQHNDLVRSRQKGIQIFLNNSKVFTGIIISSDATEEAGKETIVLHCKDYNFILEQVPIINSPYYDGMIARYAMEHIVKKAGMTSIVSNNWHGGQNEYFLPSGYSFTSPVMKFDPATSISECLLKIAKRFEAYFYFNEDGQFIIEKLSGGLFGDMSSVSDVTNFYSFPGTTPDASLLPILGTKTITRTFESTTNNLIITSVNRETREGIIYGTEASGSQNRIPFLKPMFITQPALGDMDTVKGYADELKKRVFNSIQKVSFRATGSELNIKILSFINLDDVPFRATSVKKTFDAATNALEFSVDGEWLFG